MFLKNNILKISWKPSQSFFFRDFGFSKLSFHDEIRGG